MTPDDFRRIALSFPDTAEGSHMGAIDFRVGGRIFATLASVEEGYGNLMLDLASQQSFCEEAPELFLPVKGGWGRMGITHIRLTAANEDTLRGALQTAWTLRVTKNQAGSRKPSRKSASPARKPRNG